MSKVKIELNSPGINALLHSEEIKAALMEVGSAVVGRCGDDFGAELFDMPTRSVVRVSPTTKQGAIENSSENTLLKALHGG